MITTLGRGDPRSSESVPTTVCGMASFDTLSLSAAGVGCLSRGSRYLHLDAKDFQGAALEPWYTSRMSRGSAIAQPQEPGRPVPRFRQGARFSLGVFIALRLVVSIVAVVFVSNHADPTAADVNAPPARYKEPASPGLHNAIDGMQRWDAAWFRWIAVEGYGSDDARGAFFPGYPLLIAATSSITPLDEGASATLVSNVSFALALIVFFALTCFELGSRSAARRGVALLACLPTSFFFLAPVSEAPFLLACLLAFFWARTGRWRWRVAGASFAACMLRSVGVTLVAALAMEAIGQHRRDGKPVAGRLSAAAAGLLAPAMYCAWWWLHDDAPLQPFRAQASWQRELAFPLTTIGHGLRDAWDAVSSQTGLFLLVDGALLLVALVAAVLLLRRKPPCYAAFVWASLLIPLSYTASWRPLLSIPRFSAVLFPVAWVAEERVQHQVAFSILLAASLACQLSLAVQFMNWGWIY